MAIVGASAVTASTAPAAPSRVPAPPGATCSFAPAEHTLTVRVTDLEVVARIERSGRGLVVREDQARIGCGSVRPTVSNVDTISVFARTELLLDLRHGPLAPGFSDEGDGSSEIEVQARFGRTGGLRVGGSGRGDAIVMGELEGAEGVDLNAREAQRDADVSVAGGYPVLSVLGRRGNDLVSARGGRGFTAPLDRRVTVSAGAGHDRLYGSLRRDLLGGGGGPDLVRPGGGKDRVRTLGGSDTIRARDHQRDVIRCGAGQDKVSADRKDHVAGCDLR